MSTNTDFFNGLFVGGSQVIIGYPFDTIKTVLQTNSTKIGWGSLYRGVKYPLFSNSIINSALFGINTYTYQLTNSYFVSGAISGFIGAFIICPVEQFKVRAQIMSNYRQPLFRALIPTIMRESPAYSLYFGCYHWMRDQGYNAFTSGSLVGMLSWLITYPFDIQKTQSQAGVKLDWKCPRAWHALPITLMRAFVVNGTSFTIYNYLSEEGMSGEELIE